MTILLFFLFCFRSLFPCGDHMVSIIDDRKDVWNYAPNLIHIKPYVFFKDTGDINDPAKFNNPGGGNKEKSSAFKADTESTKKSEEPIEEDAKETGEKGDKPSKEDDKGEEASDAPRDMEILDGDEGKIEDSDKKQKGKDASASKPEEKKREKEIDEVSDDLELSDDDDDDSDKEDDAAAGSAKKDDGGGDDDDEGSGSSLEDDLEEVEDTDDYLHHLQDILSTVHKAYYELYDQILEERKRRGGDGDAAATAVDSQDMPDLKTVIPYVRRKTLAGVTVAFSGVDPMNMPPEKSRARAVARSLGAAVSDAVVKGETVRDEISHNERKKYVYVPTADPFGCCPPRHGQG